MPEKLAETIAAYRKAIQEKPDQADLHVNLGVYLQQAGDLQGAVESYQRALALDRTSYSAYNNLGNLFAGLGDRQTALTFLRAAAQLNPNVADIHNNIANIYFEQEDTQAAIESYRRAIALKPDVPSYYNHLGNALRLDEQYAEAEECFRKALSLRPDFPEVYANLGYLYFEQQQIEKAEEYYRRAIDRKEDFAMAHVCLSHILLRKGDLSAGWRENEWRWQWKEFPSPKRNFLQPQWRGEEIKGARILLHAEQGFGDAIQFLRYVPMVAGRGAKVILEVHPELRRLTESVSGVTQLLSRGQALPEFDWHCPLMSLPFAFATDLETIPAKVPYLHTLLETPDWLRKEQTQNLKVGLVWAGSPKNRIDRKRSLSLSELCPLVGTKGISFFSLQRGPAVQEMESSPFCFAGSLPQSGDFAETAVAVTHLDLIITVDTSVAHLAGALGKPVWILLPKMSEWRWLTDRDDSPWYPTARLFRQKVAGEWQTVIAQIVTELSAFS
jgi:tetratricopeptide (TPR) repeat protein